MANSDYTYLQIINGMGSYQLETPAVYVDGVRELQHRLLMIGYPPPTVSGKFTQGTKDAVLAFQKESQLLVDGIAAKNTLVQLDKAYAVRSEYYLIGRPLEKWSREELLKGDITEADFLARIIWTEERGILDAQTAVAKVLQNRRRNPAFQLKVGNIPPEENGLLLFVHPNNTKVLMNRLRKHQSEETPNMLMELILFGKKRLILHVL